MKNDSVIQVKSYKFAIETIKLYKEIIKEKKEYVISKQLLRSGTSIGANIEEAIGGQSSKDFYAKLTIAYKEARESKYWIRLLFDTDYISSENKNKMIFKIDEILRIIGSIQRIMRIKMGL